MKKTKSQIWGPIIFILVALAAIALTGYCAKKGMERCIKNGGTVKSCANI
jgi:hypothetical protein